MQGRHRHPRNAKSRCRHCVDQIAPVLRGQRRKLQPFLVSSKARPVGSLIKRHVRLDVPAHSRFQLLTLQRRKFPLVNEKQLPRQAQADMIIRKPVCHAKAHQIFQERRHVLPRCLRPPPFFLPRLPHAKTVRFLCLFQLDQKQRVRRDKHAQNTVRLRAEEWHKLRQLHERQHTPFRNSHTFRILHEVCASRNKKAARQTPCSFLHSNFIQQVWHFS